MFAIKVSDALAIQKLFYMTLSIPLIGQNREDYFKDF